MMVVPKSMSVIAVTIAHRTLYKCAKSESTAGGMDNDRFAESSRAHLSFSRNRRRLERHLPNPATPDNRGLQSAIQSYSIDPEAWPVQFSCAVRGDRLDSKAEECTERFSHVAECK